jgi:hypothetical protein
MLNAVLTVYVEYDPEQKDYVAVQDRRMSSQSYTACALPYMSLQRLRGMGDFRLQAAVDCD